MKKILIGFIAIGMIVSSCKKEKASKPGVTKDGPVLTEIKYATSASSGEFTTDMLTTDNSGNVTAYETFYSSGPAFKWTSFERDVTGKVVKVTGNNLHPQTKPTVKYEFVYTGNNIIKATYTEGNTVNYTEYTYDTNNRIVKEKAFSGGKLANTTTWAYVGTDGSPATKQIEFAYDPPVFRNTTYKYDDKKNPYLRTDPILYYMGKGNFYTHNVIESKEEDASSAVTFTYTYDDAGYPITEKNSLGNERKYIYK